MSKMAVIGLGAALLLGFLFACTVVGFALLSGGQPDVGYSPGGDIVTDNGADVGFGYDTVDTTMGCDSDMGSDMGGDGDFGG